jgi:hypothetical protein
VETKEAVDFIREQARLNEGDGNAHISKKDLSKLLEITERYSSDSLVLRESRHKAQLETDLEVFRAVFVYGQAALKTTILINGGAAIAVMAFLARYVSVENQVANMQFFLSALLVFGFGVLLGAVTTGFTYLAQSFFAHRKDKLGFSFQVLSVILGLLSLSTFGLGIWFSYQGFGSAFGI